jgi:hypothetical protein
MKDEEISQVIITIGQRFCRSESSEPIYDTYALDLMLIVAAAFFNDYYLRKGLYLNTVN